MKPQAVPMSITLTNSAQFKIMLVALLALAFALVAPVSAFARPASLAPLAEQISPSVVNITTSTTVARRTGPQGIVPEGSPFEDFFRDRNNGPEGTPRRSSALGSGFVISEDGFVVTNNHVIEGADEILIEFFNGEELSAEVIGTDPNTDIALLKVESDEPLPFVSFGDSDEARVGDWVMAIGSPFGQMNSVTAGIVSARGRDIQMGSYDDFIQTDASINRGNSGGPLFNMEGEVIGINTAIFSPTGGSVGIGFAIPSTQAFAIIKQLKEYGRTRRGWLGVSIQPVTDDIAESLSMDSSRGALVAGLTAKGPAKNSGILVGDVILEFDGQQIAQMRDLPRIVAETPVGKSVDVVVLRKGEEVTVPVTLGRLEDSDKSLASNTDKDSDESEPKKKKITALGMTFDELDDEGRKKFSISDDVKGVLVSEVQPRPARSHGPP